MTESMEEWMARIGSAEAMERRQQLRAAGAINTPVKGVRGIGNLVRAMIRKDKLAAHSLTCQCDTCVPPLLKAEVKTWAPYVAPAAKPVTVIASAPVKTGKRRSKWEQRGSSGN